MNNVNIQHNIEARIARLEGKASLSEADAEELNNIDMTLTEILLRAESKLQMHKTNDTFHAKLHAAKQVRHYWRRIYAITKSDTHFSLEKYNPAHKITNINLPRREVRQNIVSASK